MIRIGILGYGNLGRGVEYAVEANPDMELVAVFTRRDPASVKPRTQVPVVAASKAAEWKDKVDVLILCGICDRSAEADAGVCEAFQCGG